MTNPPAIATLWQVIERWPDLWESRIPGTKRPWRQPTDELPPEVRAERDRLARIEKAERDDRAPGESEAPLHLDVLDLCAEILMAADLLHEHVAQTVGHPRLNPPASAYADPRPYLEYAATLLPEACEADPEMADAAAEKANAMLSKILIQLGEVMDGQKLDAICPFCCGVTTRHPSGGARTLRFRISHYDDPKQGKVPDPLIVCENPVQCLPFAAECSLWVKGRPAWRRPDWDWLAERLLPVRRVA